MKQKKGQQQEEGEDTQRTFGNVEALKKKIKDRYDAEIRALQRQYEDERREIEESTKNKVESIMKEARTLAEREAAQIEARVFSEEKLKMKREFEEGREKVLNDVLEKVKSRLAEVTHSPRYVAYLKKKKTQDVRNLKDFQVFADGDYYKSAFPQYKKDSNVIGVKLVTNDGVTYDFTLASSFENNVEMLRMEISKVLST